MKNTYPSMTWGDELAPRELQATNGGNFFGIVLGIAFFDFLYNLWLEGGDVSAAAADTGQDMQALWNAFQSMAGMGAN